MEGTQQPNVNRPETGDSRRFPVGTVMLVTRLCGMHMEWLLDADQLADVTAIGQQLSRAGEACRAPVPETDAVYGGLTIDVDPNICGVSLLHAVNGVVSSQRADGTWLWIASDVPERLAYLATGAASLTPALEWIRKADERRHAFWSRSRRRRYPPCPEPHSSYVPLIPRG